MNIKITDVNTTIDLLRAAMNQLQKHTTRRCCAHRQEDETVPGPFENWRFDVILVAQLWGSGCLLSGGRVGSVYLQSYTTQNILIISYRTYPNPVSL